MLKNYLKIAARNLLKFKAHSFINIAGLAIGMACFILIFIYVKDELGYDRYHQKAAQIYRLVGDLNRNDHLPSSAATAPPMVPAMREEFPQIINAARIAPASMQRDQVLVSYQHRRFYEKRIGYADASAFDIFTFPLVKGDSKTALAEPYTMVISETMAAKYFGNEDPLGKTLTIENEAEHEITGVMKDLPQNSHFRFDFIASFASLKDGYGGMYDCWWCRMAYTYLLLPKDLSPDALEEQLPAFLKKHIGSRAESMQLRLQPLVDIHLRSNLSDEIEPAGNLAYLYMLATVGLFILLLACANYTNLATARCAQRAKEVGVRKVVGANRQQLVGQFLGESIMLAALALPLAMVLVEWFLPAFNELTGKTLRFAYLNNWRALLGLIVVALLAGLVSGGYPAFFLSQFQAAKVLKGRGEAGTRGSVLRSALVVVQFTFSIALVVATIVVFNQLEYLRSKRLGFDKEQVVVIPIRDFESSRNYESLKSALLQNPAIASVSAASQIPPEGLPDLEVWPGDEKETGKRRMKIVVVDYGFFETLGIAIVEGRTFSQSFGTDAGAGFILNESAMEEFGWKSAVGRKFGAAWSNKAGAVIGVVEDFHFESLHQRIEPMVFFMEDWRQYIVVRLRAADYGATLAFLREQWQKIAPHRPFEYSFLDEEFDRLYKSEEKIGRLFGYFTGLAIFIAGLGLFGLAAFAAEQRTKEIGIRKVLGASVANVVTLLSKDFVKLVLLANVIAWPAAYFAMNKWLQNFAYRIEIGWWVFALAGGLALLIALATVSTQAIKAALANPVEALRYE
jgi:putative ABC transport system permease protein